MSEFAKRQVALAEGLLDDMVKQRMTQANETYEKAQAAVLRTPQGRQANATMLEFWDSGRPDVPAQVVKSAASLTKASAAAALAKADSSEQELDAMAERHAAARGMDVAKAFDEVVRTPAGRRLYAEHCRALQDAEAAGR